MIIYTVYESLRWVYIFNAFFSVEMIHHFDKEEDELLLHLLLILLHPVFQKLHTACIRNSKMKCLPCLHACLSFTL